MRYLLIGNGPSALASKRGGEIDAFDGKVVRFNNYITHGYEEYLGTRTDIWATIDTFPQGSRDKHEERWWLQLGNAEGHHQRRRELACAFMPAGWRTVSLKQGCSHPTSGLALAAYLISAGHQVCLWGFDFMSTERRHHYADSVSRGSAHVWLEEWIWFNQRLHDGTIDYLGWDRAKQGCAIARTPLACGREDNVLAYREPTQLGWYQWAAQRCAGKRVLDVGAGSCAGLDVLASTAAEASGVDMDPRLVGRSDRLRIVNDLAEVPSGSVDVVTAIDVLEHVVDDLTFMEHLKRIARGEVIVSTPNGFRSQCTNEAHCREYLIPQFANVFRPDELWTGSPDGHLHITKLLTRCGAEYVDHREEGPDNLVEAASREYLPVGKMSLTERFNQTVDGQEWAHITAIFRS